MADHVQYNLQSTPQIPLNPQGQDFNSSPNVLATSKDLVIKNFFTFNDNEAVNTKGRKIGLTRANSAYTAVTSDFYVIVPSVAVAPIITLPKASLVGIGKVYIIKDISGSASATTITISPQSGETINGDTSTSINTNYGFVGLFTDGNNWFTS